jgi:AraC family transcriptional regulator
VSQRAGAYSFGRELRSCQLDGIRISETLVPAGLRLGDHAHEPGQICFVLEGEYRERASDGEHWFHPGELQFHAPGERHSNVFSSDSDVLALLISIDRPRWTHVTAHRPVIPDAVLRNCEREIRRELRHADEAARAALEAWAMLCVSRLARHADVDLANEPSWLREAANLVKEHAADPISLSTLAATVGVHRATLSAAFRRFRRISVGQCIRRERVRQVRKALVTSKMPLCEIATECGSHDQAHMGRVFRKATGFSPGAYRATWS